MEDALLKNLTTPKHGRCAVEEFNNAVEELRDYFLGDNIYGTTDKVLMHYYGPFMSRLRAST